MKLHSLTLIYSFEVLAVCIIIITVMKALAMSNWGFTTETLVATYKATVHLILNKLRCSHLVHPSVLITPGQT